MQIIGVRYKMFLKLNMNYNTFINKYKNIVSCVYKFISLDVAYKCS